MKQIKMEPAFTEESKLRMVQRVEPYLKAGLSIRKACLLSGVPRSSLYKIIEEDEFLRDQIDQFRIYLNVLTITIISRHLHSIIKKQQSGIELSSEDLNFVKWYALNSNQCKEEFGWKARSTPPFDPEAEIMRLNSLIEQHAIEDEYYATS